jgi:hypothetical protein
MSEDSREQNKKSESVDKTDFGEINIGGILAVTGAFLLNFNFGSVYSWGAFIIY